MQRQTAKVYKWNNENSQGTEEAKVENGGYYIRSFGRGGWIPVSKHQLQNVLEYTGAPQEIKSALL